MCSLILRFTSFKAIEQFVNRCMDADILKFDKETEAVCLHEVPGSVGADHYVVTNIKHTKSS